MEERRNESKENVDDCERYLGVEVETFWRFLLQKFLPLPPVVEHLCKGDDTHFLYQKCCGKCKDYSPRE